jgi:hypothetical protein
MFTHLTISMRACDNGATVVYSQTIESVAPCDLIHDGMKISAGETMRVVVNEELDPVTALGKAIAFLHTTLQTVMVEKMKDGAEALVNPAKRIQAHLAGERKFDLDHENPQNQ